MKMKLWVLAAVAILFSVAMTGCPNGNGGNNNIIEPAFWSFATDTRFQGLTVGETDLEVIFGDDDTALPLGARSLDEDFEIEAIASPLPNQSISLLITADIPLGECWGAGVALFVDNIVDGDLGFLVGDQITVIGEVIEIGEGVTVWWPEPPSPGPGGAVTLATTGFYQEPWDNPLNVDPILLASRNSVGPINFSVTLTQAHVNNINQGVAHPRPVEDGRALAVGMEILGQNQIRIDDIIFNRGGGVPPAPSPTPTPPPPPEIPEGYTGLVIGVVREDGASTTAAAIIAANSREFAGIDGDGNLVASAEAWAGEDVYVFIEFVTPLILDDFYTFAMTWDIDPAAMPEPWYGVYFGIALVSAFDDEDAVIAEDSGWLSGPTATLEGNFDLRENTDPIVGIRINRGEDVFDIVTISDMAFAWREAPLDVTISIDGKEAPALLVVGSLEGSYILPDDGSIDIWLVTPTYIGEASYVTLEWAPNSSNWHFQIRLSFGGDSIDLVLPEGGAGWMVDFATFDINEMVAEWSDEVEERYLTGISFSGINFVDAENNPAEIVITSISIY